MNNIGIIGNGHMGSAMLQGWQRDNKYKLHALVKNPGNLAISYYTETNVIDFFNVVDVIFIAVRPSSWLEIKPLLNTTNKLKVSLMAGINLAELSSSSGNWARIMPNLPVANGQGTIGFYSHETSAYKYLSDILSPLGLVVPLQRESLLSAFTAIAGSGPAWLWHYIDLWQEAAIELGFSQQEAQKIIQQTILGTINMTNFQAIKILYQNVASKGGTTEAGLKQLALGLDLKAAIHAANNKANELAQE